MTQHAQDGHLSLLAPAREGEGGGHRDEGRLEGLQGRGNTHVTRLKALLHRSQFLNLPLVDHVCFC